MGKNITIAVLVVLVVVEGGLLIINRRSTPSLLSQSVQKGALPPAGPNARGAARPILLSRGMNLKSTPLFQYAYQIAPGVLSADAKRALVGFNIASQQQSDGSVVVTLKPKDSENQNQQYTIKPGQTLYYIEQTPVDDKTDSDKDLNYRDDYGIIVDQSGIIQ
ncbi:MAG: hypothetical protein ACHQT7_02860 [Candidatus Levyibacteriota bacterium]